MECCPGARSAMAASLTPAQVEAAEVPSHAVGTAAAVAAPSPFNAEAGVADEEVNRRPTARKAGPRKSALTEGLPLRCIDFTRTALGATPVILLGLSPWTQLAAQDRGFVACDLDRLPLRLEVLAHNPEVYPTLVTPPSRVPGGWLVYEGYERQLIELDDDLNEIARWGRSGPGPMEYSQPVAVWGSEDQVVVVDRDPPSVMVFGTDPNERVLVVSMPIGDAAFLPAEDRQVLAIMGVGLYETSLFSPGEMQLEWTYADLGIEAPPGAFVPYGGSPVLLHASPSRDLYAGSQWGSRIWHLEPPGPRLVLERCIPERLRNQHVTPVRPGYARTTLQNFQVLRDGRILTHGALPVGTADTEERSVELYGADGTLHGAWSIPFISAAFDPTNASRLLVWSEEVGLQLVKVSGPEYPSG